MISRHGDVGELPRRRLPIAFAGSPQYSRASGSEMMTTGRCSRMSFHVIERPATSRLPIVSKYPGPMLLNRRSLTIVPSGSGNSSIAA